MRDLRHKTIRAGFANICGQGASFILNLAFLMTLTRLLDPADFGLFAMVTVVTGLYGLFTSAGLSSAAVQIAAISEAQISTLFWANILFGLLLGLLCLATAPILVAFYHEPRLLWVTVAMASGFLISAAGVQHSALLQRELRYLALASVGFVSQLTGMAIGIGMAIGGFGYWALVGAAIGTQVTGTAGLWLAASWIPGKPRSDVEIRSLLRFGGIITLNTVVVYLGYNIEKALLGRFWGAEVLGIYGRAYQLASMPTERLNSAIGAVAFAALSRLQDDPIRLRSYFLRGYSLVVSITVPITIGGALFADDIIVVLFGPNWMEAATIFRLLTPTILIFGMINPLGPFLQAIGLQGRSLRIALVIAPLVLTAYIIGLPYGPSGVALAFSTAMSLWFIPHVAWCLHDTVVSPRDLIQAASRPLISGITAGAVALAIHYQLGDLLPPIGRLASEGGIMFLLYCCIILFILQQKEFYIAVFRELKGIRSDDAKKLKPRFAQQTPGGD